MPDLAGRVALVTGGNRGIGAASSVGLAADGADVAMVYRRDEESATATKLQIEELGRRAIAHQAAVDDFEALDAACDRVLADFGHVDIVVHSAGIASRGPGCPKAGSACMGVVCSPVAIVQTPATEMPAPTRNRLLNTQ